MEIEGGIPIYRPFDPIANRTLWFREVDFLKPESWHVAEWRR